VPVPELQLDNQFDAWQDKVIELGWGVEKDLSAAMIWYKKAGL